MNYLIKQGDIYYAIVQIPQDVRGVLEKRCFKKTLKTSVRLEAIRKAMPLVKIFWTVAT